MTWTTDGAVRTNVPTSGPKVVRRGLPVQSVPITSAEQDIVNRKREEHKKKMK